MLDKIFFTSILIIAPLLLTIKSWGDFDKHPFRITSLTLLTLFALIIAFACALIKIWL